MNRFYFKLIIISIFTLFTVFVGVKASAVNSAELAKEVTIYRDTYGVPHIFGPTDESVAFGLGYAQAEDNLPRIHRSLMEALGRVAELEGSKENINRDYRVRLLNIPQFAWENYDKIPSKFQAVLEGFCQGINFYLQKHPDRVPQGMTEVKPQEIITLTRYTVIANFVLPWRTMSEMIRLHEPKGSNMWAIGPKRSANGKAMLFVNPHLGWDGLVQWYEAHLHSDEGWNMIGGTFFGSPVIFLGHNETLGWSHTVNAPDTWDIYAVELNPDNLQQYRYEGRWRDIKSVKEIFRAKTESGFFTSEETLEYTHYGPVLERRGMRAYTLKLAGWDDVLALYQWYRMNKAKNLAEFKEALSMLAIPMFNCVYADVQGNIFYLYNGKVAHKSEQYDWREIIPGGTRATEWGDYLAIDELPQVLNPVSQFVQNCNSTPFQTTLNGNPNPEEFPRYLVGEGMNMRAERARQILEADDSITLEEFKRMAFDNYVLLAERAKPDLIKAFSDLPETEKQKYPKVAEAIDIIEEWDNEASKDSIAMSIFHYWAQIYRSTVKRDEPLKAIESLKKAIDELERQHGTFKVKWGDIHCIKRGDKEYAIDGGQGSYGILHVIGSRRRGGKWYAHGGHSYVMVAVMSQPIEAYSIFPYGSSRIPGNKHYADQTLLFSNNQFKPAWFTKEEIMTNLEEAYHPGE
ncbi:TPA: hypothetical protein EYP66_09215 [Candidatus Poribacteria bacterium]|nr:hypothetical protein [Candidatus Poribacteria bacterium]